ncbi:XAC0095 family protein [Dyella nitratireducens]|uniref:XAC0095-like domain-containing protein n=1 Tax=Dyella nitratireducens TaxID=1849580 RepID=A0ABQ1FLD3_9GAMM|nr:hypothetical protein [Dyella nitratireducens]GGA19528.1 hypothetical protein GCM10010981_04420 [Dyella nitratireducens]GLQ44497.1 hypothetical protein GCM10007902_43470 [Dyella nitratireducens]
MENMQGEPRGPQLYLLSQDGYEILKRLLNMLNVMAHITYNEENAVDDNTTMTIGRAELYFIFQAIILQVDDVLECLGNENWLETESRTWQ